jgi:hypothetical protein
MALAGSVGQTVPRGERLDDEARKQVVRELDTLRDQVSERLGTDPIRHDPVAAHVEELRTLVQHPTYDAQQTRASAGGLERRLLAWEAEHPQLVGLAARIARVLEDAGL